MKQLIIVFALLLTSLLNCQQGPGELTSAQARAKAQTHAKSLFGLNLDLANATARYRSYGDGRRQKWVVISARSEYQFMVDAVDGTLRGFINNARRHDQWKGVGRTGQQRFQTEGQVRTHLATLGRHLGIPADASLTDITWKRDGEVGDANNSGYLGAYFRSPAGKVIAIINCDPQDGTLVMFTRED